MYNQQIKTFITVADCGSFSKAAEKLFITTVSVMKQVNTLENHIGVKLLVRTNHGVKLTKEGETVYKTGKEIIELSEKTINKLQGGNKNLTIRIGTSLLYPANPLVDLWNKVQNPDIKINIVPMGDSYTNLLTLADELGKTIDCFASGYDSNHIDKNHNIYPLGENSCHISVPKNHKLANKKKLKLSDLYGENLMLLKKGNSPVIDKIRNTIETKHPKINIIDVATFYNAQVFNECVEYGYLMETPSIWANIHPSLVSIPVEWDYKLKFGIIYPKKPNKAIKTFLEKIEKVINEKE
ncbi:LysR family transcriptional regulator [bacterium]|nr:LysR family transcriptional regulator [bacterium]